MKKALYLGLALFIMIANAEDLIDQSNKDYLAKDYLGDKAQIIDAVILNKKGYRPYLLIAYNQPNTGKIYFESVSWKNQQFSRIFKDSVDSGPFLVGSQKFNQPKNTDGPIIFEGCYPHVCSESWGVFAYYVESDKGFYAAIDFSKKYLAIVDSNKIGSEYESFYDSVSERAFSNCSRGFDLINKLQSKSKTIPEGKKYFLGCPEIEKIQKELEIDNSRIDEIRFLGREKNENIFLIDLVGKPKMIFLFKSEGNLLPLSTESFLLMTSYFQLYRVNQSKGFSMIFEMPQGASGTFSQLEIVDVFGKEIRLIENQKIKEKYCQMFGISCLK